jgi:hypothetical protein
MPNAETAAARVERTTERLDKFLDLQARRAMHAFADEASPREEQRREQDEAKRDLDLRHANARRRYQARYDETFSQFGEQVPQPSGDEYPGDYRRRLFSSLQRKLAAGHDLAGVRADELDTSLIGKLEPELLAAAQAEAERPSRGNLPKDGTMIERTRVDSRTGGRETRFFGRESFIKAMGQAPRRVVGIFGTGGRAVWPPALQSAGFVRVGLMRE